MNFTTNLAVLGFLCYYAFAESSFWKVAAVCFAVNYVYETIISLIPTAFQIAWTNKLLFYCLPQEDPRIDRKCLEEKGKVCYFLSGSGDNALDSLMEDPKKVYIADKNPAQIAWVEMKICLMKHFDHQLLWALFYDQDGREFDRRYGEIRQYLSPSAQLWWDRKDHKYFNQLYYRGLAGFSWWSMSLLLGSVPGFRWISAPEGKRRETYREDRKWFIEFARVAYFVGLNRYMAFLLGGDFDEACPLWHPEGVIAFMDQVMLDNDFEENSIMVPTWFGRYGKSVPRWLKKENFEFMKSRMDRIKVLCGWSAECLRQIPENSVDRFQLMDHLDWMTPEQILDEFDQIHRVATEDNLVMWKSFVRDNPKVLGCLPRFKQEIMDRHYDKHDWYPSYHGQTVTKLTKDMSFKRSKPDYYDSFFTNVVNFWYMAFQPQVEKIKAKFSSPKKPGLERADSNKDFLEAFYEKQADTYDLCRDKMLHGRPLLMQTLPFFKGCTLIDVGGGTGYNLEYLSGLISSGFFKQIFVIDICDNLLKRARQRIQLAGWEDYVTVLCRDATKSPIVPHDVLQKHGIDQVDFVTYSYSLCMIPEWEKSLKAAEMHLKPGGYLGAADFTIDGNMWLLERVFWKKWFSFDHVTLTDRHLTKLREYTDEKVKTTGYGGFPLFQWAKCKYYVYCGQKPFTSRGESETWLAGEKSAVARNEKTTKEA